MLFSQKNRRNKVSISFLGVFLGSQVVDVKSYEDERGRSRKREQKVWLGSKQVYHLDDDQHQQNQSRIQALLLSISPFDYEDYDEPSEPSTKHDTFPKDINIIKNANKNKKVFYQLGFFFG